VAQTSSAVFDTLAQQLVPAAGPAVVSHGILVLTLAPAELLPTVRRLRDEFAFDVFLDVTRSTGSAIRRARRASRSCTTSIRRSTRCACG